MRPSAKKTLAIVDYYGLPEEVTSSDRYPVPAWNGTWICPSTGAPVEGGTAVYIYYYDGPATYEENWTWAPYCGPCWTRDDDLSEGPTYVAYVHLRQASAECTGVGGYGNCGAHIISHEVGHALGLEDECGFNDGTSSIMQKDPDCSGVPNQYPSYWDKRVAEVCLIYSPWTFRC